MSGQSAVALARWTGPERRLHRRASVSAPAHRSSRLADTAPTGPELDHDCTRHAVLAAASLVHNPASVKGPHYDTVFAASQPLCEESLTVAASSYYQAERNLFARPRASLRTDATLLRFLQGPSRLVGLGSRGQIEIIETANGNSIRILPIDLSTRDADPNALLRRAQDEMHMDLRGTDVPPRR